MPKWEVINNASGFPFAFWRDSHRGVSIRLAIDPKGPKFSLTGYMCFEGSNLYAQADVYVTMEQTIEVRDIKIVAPKLEYLESESLKRASGLVYEFVDELKQGFLILKPALYHVVKNHEAFSGQKEEFIRRIDILPPYPYWVPVAEDTSSQRWVINRTSVPGFTDSTPIAELYDVDDTLVAKFYPDTSTGYFAIKVISYSSCVDGKQLALIYPTENKALDLSRLSLDLASLEECNISLRRFIELVAEGIKSYSPVLMEFIANSPKVISGDGCSAHDVLSWLSRIGNFDASRDIVSYLCTSSLDGNINEELLKKVIDEIEGIIIGLNPFLTKARIVPTRSELDELSFDVDYITDEVCVNEKLFSFYGDKITLRMIVNIYASLTDPYIEVCGPCSDSVLEDVRFTFAKALSI